MRLNPAVFDVWVFRRAAAGIEFLILQTSQLKADRYFNGGRFWQVPSNVFGDGETVLAGVDRELDRYGLRASEIWAAEHAYTIYNRRFDEIQIITVYAAEIDGADPRLDAEEHSAHRWCSFDAALAAVHFRGLKDGLRSVQEYVTGVQHPAPELCLRTRASTRADTKTETQQDIDAATQLFTKGLIGRDELQRRVTDALAAAYLRWDDPRWQSGFDGDAQLWREARSLILDAVERDGSLLDVGCANGHLMESLVVWAREHGQALDVYGLELNPDLAAAARRRMPALAHHIFAGNVSDWTPPRRFTYVRTGLEYVPAGEEGALLRRLADEFTEPGGRVIVGPVNESALEETIRAFDSAGLSTPGVASRADHLGKTRYVAWATAPASL